MANSNLIEKLHAKLEDVKSLKRISYKDFGLACGYTDTGFKKALENRTLSIDAIESIVNKFELQAEFAELFQTITRFSEPEPLYGKTIEDMIAKRTMENLKPYLQKIELMEVALVKMGLKLDAISEKITTH